jgi:autophagy-related protein 9
MDDKRFNIDDNNFNKIKDDDIDDNLSNMDILYENPDKEKIRNKKEKKENENVIKEEENILNEKNEMIYDNNKSNQENIIFERNLISDSIINYDKKKYSYMKVYDNDNDNDEFSYNSDEITDRYLKSIYRYYIKGGYKGLYADIIKNMIINIFTLLFSTFILLMINFNKLFKCDKINNCENLNDILYKKAFNNNGLKDYFVITYFIIYSIECIYNLIKNIKYIFENKEIKKLFYYELKITDEEIRGMKWNDILKELVNIHNSGKIRIFKSGYKISGYMINHSILRIENYMIGLLNNNILKLKILNIDYTENYINSDLEWYIKNIINELYTDSRLINQYKLKNKKIKRFFKLIGIIYIILIPYKIVNYLLNFIFNHAEDMRSKREDKNISKLDWTLYAKWKFKEYNELNYIFDKRIHASYKYADMYKRQYFKPVLNSINETIIFISKSFLSLIILITIIDDNLIINMNILDKNLLWYIAFLSIILTFSRNTISDQKHLIYCSEKIMRNLSIYTHYFPDKWKNNCNKIFVRKEFDKLYINKITILIYDLIYIIISPILYLLMMNRLIDNIYNFIKKNTNNINGVGDVCSYSNFEKDDENYITGNTDNKIMNSIINYNMSNPDWTLSNNKKIVKDEDIKDINIGDYFLKHNYDNKLEKYLYGNDVNKINYL